MIYLILLFREGHDIKCRSRTYGRWSNADVMAWMLLTIKLSNISHDFSIISREDKLILYVSLLNSQISQMFLIILKCPPYYLQFLTIIPDHLLCWWCPPWSPWCPPDLPCFLLMIPISSLISCFRSCSHVISHCPPCYLPCWSWWWSWLNLSDDVLPCYHLLANDVFMPVSFLCGDYRGWLLIIFILNILLWWPLFLSF